jgi:hypothetical protein
MSQVTENWYSFKVKIGCNVVYFNYEPPGENWDPNYRPDPFALMPMGAIFGKRTEQEKIDEERDARSRLAPKFVIEQVRSPGESDRVHIESYSLDRESMEDLRDALTKLLEYDQTIRQEWGDESA